IDKMPTDGGLWQLIGRNEMAGTWQRSSSPIPGAAVVSRRQHGDPSAVGQIGSCTGSCARLWLKKGNSLVPNSISFEKIPIGFGFDFACRLTNLPVIDQLDKNSNQTFSLRCQTWAGKHIGEPSS